MQTLRGVRLQRPLARVLISLALLLACGAGYLQATGNLTKDNLGFNLVRASIAAEDLFGQNAVAREGVPTSFGEITGTVRGPEGAPIGGAFVLVSTPTGRVISERTSADGHFRLRDVPAGSYVPIAGKHGYEPAFAGADPLKSSSIAVRANASTDGTEFTLLIRKPLAAAADDLVTFFEQVEVSTNQPAPGTAKRTRFTYINENLVLTGYLYEPLDMPGPLPVVLVEYPSDPPKWENISTPLACQGYILVALCPQRMIDVDGAARDLLKAEALVVAGKISPNADAGRMGSLGGSFGSMVTYRALRERTQVKTTVGAGGPTDVFQMLNDFYWRRFVPPPPFDVVLRKLETPDRDPAFALRHSPVFYPESLPPTLMIHATSDAWVPVAQSYRLDAALTAAGRPHEIHVYDQVDHYLDISNPSEQSIDMFWKVVHFFDRHLKGN